jgi:hypothetical protein
MHFIGATNENHAMTLLKVKNNEEKRYCIRLRCSRHHNGILYSNMVLVIGQHLARIDRQNNESCNRME